MAVVALALESITSHLNTTKQILNAIDFLIGKEIVVGSLGDRNGKVRAAMLNAGLEIVKIHGSKCMKELLARFDDILSGSSKALASVSTETQDWVRESVVVLLGTLGQFLSSTDDRVPQVVYKLVEALKTPSESVQMAVSTCLGPLIKQSPNSAPQLIQLLLDQLLNGTKYGDRRGAAFSIAEIVKGGGSKLLREYSIMNTLG